MAYTKLFSSIVHSTIWREEPHVKIVWVTMLALASKRGVVSASIPGLADVCRVSLEQTLDALKRLSSPDPFSRSKVEEGRRIHEVEGGWQIVNHTYYRELRDEDQERIDTAERVRKHRARARVTETNKSNAPSRSVLSATSPTPSPSPAPSPAPTPTDNGLPVAAQPVGPPAKKPRVRETNWLTPYCDAWQDRWGAESSPPIGEMLRPLAAAEKALTGDRMECVSRWRRFLAAAERSEWARPARFAQGLGQWGGNGVAPPTSSPGRRLTAAEVTGTAIREILAEEAAKKASLP